MSLAVNPGSFRDPSGFVFSQDRLLFRQINQSYKPQFEALLSSGLYDTLVEENILVPHQEANIPSITGDGYKVIQPERIPFISYPYEWAFSALKAAALLVLNIQKKAISCGMILKDASAFNVQFKGTKPIWIDTLSFDFYRENEPWLAYRQFCQHFLGPLSLMSYRDVRLNQLLKSNIDGLPLDLVSRLLPLSSKWQLGLLSHIHLHSQSQKHFEAKEISPKSFKFKKSALLGILDSLESTIQGLNWRPKKSTWDNYYNITNYSDSSMDHKKELVEEFIKLTNPKMVWDLGSNTGKFSRIVSAKGIQTVSIDFDPLAVEINFLEAQKNKTENLLPLNMDLNNPSPGLGWAHTERMSLIERGPADAVLALALVHHLAISNNVPLPAMAEFFSKISKFLIIEFIPKEDSQVKILLRSREDIFPNFTKSHFESAFAERFKILKSVPVRGSKRTMYLMEKI